MTSFILTPLNFFSLFLLYLSLKVDQPFMLSLVFYSYPFSSTVCITYQIFPRGLSIRHAKVKTSYCHLAWLNVYQARLYTYISIHMESGRDSHWERLERVFASLSACMCYQKVTQIILLSLVTLKVHGEQTQSFRGGRMSSFITCSRYQVSQ